MSADHAAGEPAEPVEPVAVGGAAWFSLSWPDVVRAVVLCLVAGAVGGVVWKLVAPVAQIRIESQGGFFVDPDPEQYVASDAWYAIISVVVGLVVGVLVWRWSRGQSWSAVVGLLVGGVLGAVVLKATGEWLGRVDTQAAAKLPAGTVISVPLRLQAGGLQVVLGVTALTTWLVCDLVSDWRRRRAEPRVSPQPVAPPEPPSPLSA